MDASAVAPVFTALRRGELLWRDKPVPLRGSRPLVPRAYIFLLGSKIDL